MKRISSYLTTENDYIHSISVPKGNRSALRAKSFFHRIININSSSIQLEKYAAIQLANFCVFLTVLSYIHFPAVITLHVIAMTRPVIIHQAPSQIVLPSYTALKPCALTAKSVVNHKANMDPLLTIGEGSINPDNLKDKEIVQKNASLAHSKASSQCC